jgi:hypothetical protein
MRVSLKVYHRRFKEIEREIHEVERNKRGWQLAIFPFSFFFFRIIKQRLFSFSETEMRGSAWGR